MASFGTDFLATLDEICDFVEGWLDRYPINLCAFAFPPERMVPITRETIREVLARPEVGSLIFTEFDVDPSWRAAYDAGRSGVEPLRLNIGRLESRGLEESFLSTKNADTSIKPIWKKINADLKKKTTAGADILWEDGTTRYSPNVRFTPGAKALAASGVPLRQFHQSDFIYQPK